LFKENTHKKPQLGARGFLAIAKSVLFVASICNYLMAPPKPQEPPQEIPEKTYPDYSLQYGIRELGGCDRYFNGQPHC
jgi:hypothetical protein